MTVKTTAYYYWGCTAKALDAALSKARSYGMSPDDVVAMSKDPEAAFARVSAEASQLGVLSGEDGALVDALAEMARESEDEGSVRDYYDGYNELSSDTVTGEEAAGYLGVTKQRVYAMVKSGILRGYKVGREWRLYRHIVVARKAETYEATGSQENAKDAMELLLGMSNADIEARDRREASKVHVVVYGDFGEQAKERMVWFSSAAKARQFADAMMAERDYARVVDAACGDFEGSEEQR